MHWKSAYGIGPMRSTSGDRSRNGRTASAPSSMSPTYSPAIATQVSPRRCSGTNSSGGPLNMTNAVPSSSGAS